MKKLQCALIQAFVVVVLGFVVAFAHNALSVNGINPFRNVADVPVVAGEDPENSDGICIVTLEEFLNCKELGRIIIDARTSEEYIQGHIPGAVLLDYYEMGRYFKEVLPILSPEHEILLYCAGPECEDSELLARELYTLGFKKLMVFKGGFEEWENAGLPVEKGMM
jgi:rhodanese-related sulfurtransferase